MKIFFPIAKNDGLNSEVHPHFGSTPLFLSVDSETKKVTPIDNNNDHSSHGQCTPIQAIGCQNGDCLVVGGIGAGAVNKLNAAGIKVYKTRGGTVGEDIASLEQKELAEFTLAKTCAGHKQGCGRQQPVKFRN